MDAFFNFKNIRMVILDRFVFKKNKQIEHSDLGVVHAFLFLEKKFSVLGKCGCNFRFSLIPVFFNYNVNSLN